MFGIGKKTLLVVGGYLVGSLVSTLYSDKKGKKVREDLEEAKGNTEKTKKIVVDNFIDTHKNFLESFKQNVLSEENKDFFSKKIDDAKNLVKEYKKEGEKLYETKKSDLKDLQSEAPEKIEKVKNKLLSKFDEVKGKISK